MKIEELIAKLKDLPPEMEVALETRRGINPEILRYVSVESCIEMDTNLESEYLALRSYFDQD